MFEQFQKVEKNVRSPLVLRFACRKQNHFNYYLEIIIKNMLPDNSQENHSNQRDSQIFDSSHDQLLSSTINQFNHALQKFKCFLLSLNEEKIESLEDEIIEYSGKKFIKTLSNDDIIKLCVKRIQKMMRNKKTKKNWGSNDVLILVWILNKYAAFYAKKSVYLFVQQDWKFVSSLMPATSGTKCMFKWLSLKKFSLMEFKWTKRESNLLEILAQKNEKKDWKRIAEVLHLRKSSMKKVFRTPKQCREHWNCYANPEIKKGPWALKEDIKLFECKWSWMSKRIKGRTQNAVKNRFSLLVEKQKWQNGQQNQQTLIKRILVRLLQENSSQQLEVGLKKSEEVQMQEEIYEGSKNSSVGKQVNQPENGDINNQDNKENIQEIQITNVMFPPVVLNLPVYALQTYYPIASSFNPYFFHFLYGNHYQIN